MHLWENWGHAARWVSKDAVSRGQRTVWLSCIPGAGFSRTRAHSALKYFWNKVVMSSTFGTLNDEVQTPTRGLWNQSRRDRRRMESSRHREDINDATVTSRSACSWHRRSSLEGRFVKEGRCRSQAACGGCSVCERASNYQAYTVLWWSNVKLHCLVDYMINSH